MEDPHAGCDRQDIIRAGITQDIGVVAVVDTTGLLFALSSDHYHHGWVKKEIRLEDLETIKVDDVFHADIVHIIYQGIDVCGNKKTPTLRTYVCDIFYAHRTYVTILSQSDGRLVIEIEDFDRNMLCINSIVDTANIIGELTANTTIEDTVNDLCRSVFHSSSYDRAMVYKFLDDLSGEVVYEIQDDKTTTSSFLGLRFPPGDIPIPARNAYIRNPMRFIADVEKDSCQLIQKNSDIALSRSFLRGCVLPHICYLRNMGVRSSLSLAITNMDGELWGLIAMHSYTQPIIPKIEERVSYAILASVASTHVQTIENSERLDIESRMKNLISQIDTRQSLGVFILQNKEELFEIFAIDSVSLFTPDGPPTTVGEDAATPGDIPIDGEHLSYGCLERPIRSFACLNILGYRLVFTRKSSYKSISWAGNPRELSELDVPSDIAMPRKSFHKYLTHQSETPPPFTKYDRIVFFKTIDVLKSSVHQMKIERAETKATRAQKQSDMVEVKSDENYAFFANMSHELRTPLHAITGVFDILDNLEYPEKEKYDDDVRRYSKIGLETCKDMMKTLNDILGIVRKTHEEKELHVSLTMVREIFNSTSDGLVVFAQRHDVFLDIAFECDADKLVCIELNKTIQIYNNIVGNAIKFSPSKDARVVVRLFILGSRESVSNMWTDVSREYTGRHKATQDDDERTTPNNMCKWLVFTTRDCGCGVHVDDMSKIFKMFAQASDVITKRFASTGLGLHISLNNVNALHGFLAVASTPGKGSLFFCAIPVEEAIQNNVPIQNNDQETVYDSAQGFGSGDFVFVVVDDSKVNLMIAKKQIERAFVKAKVYTAANGQLGVEEVGRLKSESVDVDGIFMDYHMPVLSGLEATRQIKKMCTSPVAMLTADITEISRQSMLSSGADFILLKPSRPQETVAMCVKMLQLKKS